jgi:hypothetical protein
LNFLTICKKPSECLNPPSNDLAALAAETGTLDWEFDRMIGPS